jgi:hypothetical protein
LYIYNIDTQLSSYDILRILRLKNELAITL